MDLEKSSFKDIEEVSGDNILLEHGLFNIFVDILLEHLFNFVLESFKFSFALLIGCGEIWEDSSLSVSIDVVFGVSIGECGLCSRFAVSKDGEWSIIEEVSEFVCDEVCQGGVEVGNFSRDL